jgi:N-acetylglucosamine malate deacetylase 1
MRILHGRDCKAGVTRREMLIGATKMLSVLALGSAAMAAPEPGSAPQKQDAHKLKIIVTGGHPGDPECGCGGTVARYTDLGHDVVLLYLNSGQAYCGQDKSQDCGAVRTAEAEKACAILKARGAFAGQYDGRAVVDNAHYEDFRRLFDAQKPDVVLAQWPIDLHRDHCALSSLVLDAWLQSGRKSAFYYYGIAEDTRRIRGHFSRRTAQTRGMLCPCFTAA